MREKTAATVPGSGPAAPPVPAAAAVPEDLRTVHGWVARLAPNPAEAERLLAEILRRYRTGSPACLRAASDGTRLQFETVSSILRLRGVL